MLTTLAEPGLTEGEIPDIRIDDRLAYPVDLSDVGRGVFNGFHVRSFRLPGLPEEGEIKVVINK
jgi:hypothetical protein